MVTSHWHTGLLSSKLCGGPPTRCAAGHSWRRGSSSDDASGRARRCCGTGVRRLERPATNRSSTAIVFLACRLLACCRAEQCRAGSTSAAVGEWQDSATTRADEGAAGRRSMPRGRSRRLSRSSDTPRSCRFSDSRHISSSSSRQISTSNCSAGARLTSTRRRRRRRHASSTVLRDRKAAWRSRHSLLSSSLHPANLELLACRLPG